MPRTQKRQEWKKKRAARFADYNPPTRVVIQFYRRPALIHRGRLTEAALRALFAVTNEQL